MQHLHGQSADPDGIEAIRFSDLQERVLFAEAHLGEQAHAFCSSPVGRLMVGRALEEIEQAKADALAIQWWSPFARRRLKQAQMRAEVARLFIRWLEETKADGDDAYAQLKARN